ncbi:MAG TPA: helix-turn-helix transcriptional regulator [Candidatus Pullilachnospira intestinigallinarum]|nr:helix-turn-helix transcriptional regulator [Candidatus Pullilachnospira intestinigallinarum]
MSTVNIIQRRKMEGLRLFFNTLEYRTPHFHKDFELVWAVNGNLHVKSEQKSFLIKEGEMVFLNTNQPHEMKKAEESCTILTFQIAPDLLENEVPDIRNIFFSELGLNSLTKNQKVQVEKLLLEVAGQYIGEAPYFALYCRSRLQELVYLMLTGISHHTITDEKQNESKLKNARLQRLFRFVDQNYMKKIRLNDFAEMEGLSLSSVSHFMKKETNMSFQEYVNYVRFNAACSLIMTTKYNMMDICMESGFSDYRYFSNTFLRKTGMTPREYSEKVRSLVGDETKMHHNIYSKERFYTAEQSLKLLEKYSLRYAG